MHGVVIVGAGIGGLATALLLGREGRDVVVCERDPAPVPASTEQMWSGWKRPGIPQAPLGHTFLPGFRRLLTERAPDVVERLYAAGAPLVDYAKDMPGAERRPQDAELQAIMCRRAVLEGILRQTVAAEPTVEIRPGCDVVGLVAEPSAMAGVPRVVGVRTGDRGAIAADTVVVAGGRLAPVPRWLEAIGAHAPGEFSEGCGFVTFTRFFRINLRPDEDHRVATRLTVEGDPGYMSYEIFGADASTFCVELSPPAWDHDLRGLRHEAVHMAAAHTLPESEGWLDPGRATPIGPVAAMGQERNVLREFVCEGRPVALGLHVIGDARCQLDSLYAWGSGMALAGAVTLVDLLAEYHGDSEAQALAFEARLGAEIRGRHELSLVRDRAHARRYRGQPQWDDPDTGLGLMESTVVPAARDDPEVFRAVMRADMQLDPVGVLLENTAVIARARAVAALRGPEPPSVPAPARERLLELIGQAGVLAVE
jgi:2-polyprenyl-6-methoxyphenol hydroxylase-like FAD-dependent oxidoreductase